jgi:DNA polymerase IV
MGREQRRLGHSKPPRKKRHLPAGKFHGIGPATGAKMNALGLYTGLDMRNQPLDFMQANFGKAGAHYYWISRGVDNREVRANRIRKSAGAENTFSTDLTEFDVMMSELQPLIDKVWWHCEDKGIRGRTVTLKVKFADFELISRSRTVASALASRDELEFTSTELLRVLFPMNKAVRFAWSLNLRLLRWRLRTDGIGALVMAPNMVKARRRRVHQAQATPLE